MRSDTATRPEAVWQKALQVRGREWVIAELKRRPGQPRDPLLDVVFEEPYPTREYCQSWCAEEESHFHIFSWSTAAAGALLVVSVVCAMHAVSSRSEQEAAQTAQALSTAVANVSPTPLVSSAPPTNDIPMPSSTSANRIQLPSVRLRGNNQVGARRAR
jgi:hypothetical protein